MPFLRKRKTDVITDGGRLLVALLLLCAGAAAAQEAPANDLAERQRRLEELVHAQQLQLDAQATELRALHQPADPPTGPHLIVANQPKDPDLAAPLAGYSEKNFFIRDRHSWFVFILKGRLNIDWYNFLNRPSVAPGIVPNSAQDQRASLRDGVFIRRARIGLAGTFFKHVDWRIEADFASLATPGQYATLTDASVNLNWVPWLQLEVGQFYSPFTLENTTSENYTDFLEKAAPVRWAVPTARDTGAMLYGIAPHKLGRYYLGVFNGDGQNFKNLDNQPAVLGRLLVSPLALLPRGHAEWLDDVWVGASFWWQRADNVAGGQPASTTGGTAGDVAGLSTEGGFSVFSSNYGNGSDANKNAIRSHLGVDGNVVKWAVEANLPITSRFGLRGELLHQSIDLRRYDDVIASGNPTRSAGAPAHLDGYGGYAELIAWVGGPINVDKVGLYQAPHWNGYILAPPPRWAVQLVARYEHTEFAISELEKANGGKIDPANGHYALDTLLVGANLWFSRHMRLMANYGLNYVGAGGPGKADAGLIAKNLFYRKYEHELLFRLQINL